MAVYKVNVSVSQILTELGIHQQQMNRWIREGHLEEPVRPLTDETADDLRLKLKILKHSFFKLKDLAKEMGMTCGYVRHKLRNHTTAKRIYPIELKEKFRQIILHGQQTYVPSATRYRDQLIAKGFYSGVEAAKYLAMPLVTFRSWLATGKIPRPTHRHKCQLCWIESELKAIKKTMKKYFKERQ